MSGSAAIQIRRMVTPFAGVWIQITIENSYVPPYAPLPLQECVDNQIDTVFTYLDPNTELFKVVNVPIQDTLEEYAAGATKE